MPLGVAEACPAPTHFHACASARLTIGVVTSSAQDICQRQTTYSKMYQEGVGAQLTVRERGKKLDGSPRPGEPSSMHATETSMPLGLAAVLVARSPISTESTTQGD